MYNSDELTELEIKLLTTIRRNNDLSKSNLVNVLSTPWSTVSNAIKKLEEKERIIIKSNTSLETKTSDHASKYGAKISINDEYEYYIGVSAGSSNVKLVILDYSLNIVKQECLFDKYGKLFSEFCKKMRIDLEFNEDISTEYCQWCSITPDSTEELRRKLQIVTEYICSLKEYFTNSEQKFNIGAICYTFPGLVDYDNQKILNTMNDTEVGFYKCDIYSILSSTLKERLQELNINVFIDHNVKNCAIAEQEALYIKDKKNSDRNLIVLYLGKGIGIGMILDGRLYRGNNNTAGQFGRRVIQYSDFNDENQEKKLEDIIRVDVFECDKDNRVFTQQQAKALTDFISDSSHKKNRELLVHILAQSLGNVIKDLGVGHIVFSGKFNKIFREIENDLRREFEKQGQYELSLEGSNYGEYPAAVGAAMSCFNKLNNIPFIWDYDNN